MLSSRSSSPDLPTLPRFPHHTLVQICVHLTWPINLWVESIGLCTWLKCRRDGSKTKTKEKETTTTRGEVVERQHIFYNFSLGSICIFLGFVYNNAGGQDNGK